MTNLLEYFTFLTLPRHTLYNQKIIPNLICEWVKAKYKLRVKFISYKSLRLNNVLNLKFSNLERIDTRKFGIYKLFY